MSLKFKHQEVVASIGDTIRVHQEIKENDSTRIQVFEGILIAIKNRGRNKSFTVRKISANKIGVEKIFPVYLPSIKEIEVMRKGDVRRSKLYYLRNKGGKAAKITEEVTHSTDSHLKNKKDETAGSTGEKQENEQEADSTSST